MNVLAIAIIIAALLAAWHLFWEGFAAPNLRMIARYRLFELRDKLRALKIEKSEELPDNVFALLDDGLNLQIRCAGEFHVSQLRTIVQAYKNDDELHEWVDSAFARIKECDIEEIDEIQRQSCVTMMWMVVVNSGGWIPYVVPGLILIASWQTGYRAIRSVFFSGSPASCSAVNAFAAC